jgi:hypothetical protein
MYKGIMFPRAFTKPDVYTLQVSGLSVKDHCFINNLSMWGAFAVVWLIGAVVLSSAASIIQPVNFKPL